MLMIWLLFAVGAIATGACFVRGARTAGILGVLAGLGVVVVLVVPGLADIRLLGFAAGFLYSAAMVGLFVTRPSPGAPEVGPASGSHRLRRAIIGGLIGIVPGALVITVPILLHELEVISADASQVGFFGIFLVPLGLVVGVLAGAMTGAHGGRDEHHLGYRS